MWPFTPNPIAMRALEAMERSALATAEAAKAQAEAAKAQMESMSQWIALFQQAQGQPASHTVRDEDEWLAEQRRDMEKSGFPISASQRDQLNFVLQAIDGE